MAASYLTEWDGAFRSSKTKRMYFGCTCMSTLWAWNHDPYSVGSIRLAVFSDQLDYGQLHQLVKAADLIIYAKSILDSLRSGVVQQKDEGITFASHIRLGGKECLDQFRSIWD
jgi:hypothetical protein